MLLGCPPLRNYWQWKRRIWPEAHHPPFGSVSFNGPLFHAAADDRWACVILETSGRWLPFRRQARSPMPPRSERAESRRLLQSEEPPSSFGPKLKLRSTAAEQKA